MERVLLLTLQRKTSHDKLILEKLPEIKYQVKINSIGQYCPVSTEIVPITYWPWILTFIIPIIIIIATTSSADIYSGKKVFYICHLAVSKCFAFGKFSLACFSQELAYYFHSQVHTAMLLSVGGSFCVFLMLFGNINEKKKKLLPKSPVQILYK